MNILAPMPELADALSRYYVENRAHLSLWEPLREPGFHSVPRWRERLGRREKDHRGRRAAYFTALDEAGEVIGVCELTNVIAGPFQACHIGYSIAKCHEGKGKMKKIAQHAIDYAFNELQLNRIMANYMPDNKRSAYLLLALGFEAEGYAKRYLKINGYWEDHVLTSLLNVTEPDQR